MVPEETLKETFDRIWEEIHGSNLYAGQPRNEASAHSVSRAQHALQLAINSGHDRLMIEAWRMLAYSLTANEQYEEAIPYHKSAVEKLEQLGEHRQAARSRIGYVAALAHVGRLQEALGVASTAEQWFAENDDEQGRARLFTNLGIIYHRLDEHTQGVEYYGKAAAIFEKLGDKRALAQTCNNLGNVLSMLDQFEQSDNFYDRAEKLSEELKLAHLVAQASYNRAYLQYLRGRYSEALHSFSRLRQRFERAGSHRHCALCDLDEAEIYLEINLSQDASILAERAVEEFRLIGMPYEQAKAASFYGVALMQMQRFDEALDAFQSAQEIFEEEGNLYWIGVLDLYRAEVHLSMNRPSEAQSLARQTKLAFEELAIPSKEIFSLVLLGRAAIALNDLQAAETSATEISKLIQTTKMPLVLLPYHVLCGEIAERMQRWDDALLHYERGAEELEKHQTRLHHDDLRDGAGSGVFPTLRLHVRNEAEHHPISASVQRSRRRARGREAARAASSWSGSALRSRSLKFPLLEGR